MKPLIDLKNKIKDRGFFLSQFQQRGEKNILFVNPMLSGKHLYKMLLPYFKLPQLTECRTAVTGLSEFDMHEQLVGYKSIDIMNNPDSETMIKWSTHIVFPFVLQPLSEIYDYIRDINPACKIIYNIDFNFYELPKSHPLNPMFDEDFVIPIVEDNMYFSDTVLVSNLKFQEYLIKKLTELVKTKYVGVYRSSVYDQIKVHRFPIITDEAITMANVDYDASGIIFKVPVPTPESEKNTDENKILPTEEKKSKLAASKSKTKPTAVKKKKSVVKKVPKKKGKGK